MLPAACIIIIMLAVYSVLTNSKKLLGRSTVLLQSGGKDSCFNMMQCVAEGHDIVALANLKPKDKGKKVLI